MISLQRKNALTWFHMEIPNRILCTSIKIDNITTTPCKIWVSTKPNQIYINKFTNIKNQEICVNSKNVSEYYVPSGGSLVCGITEKKAYVTALRQSGYDDTWYIVRYDQVVLAKTKYNIKQSDRYKYILNTGLDSIGF